LSNVTTEKALTNRHKKYRSWKTKALFLKLKASTEKPSFKKKIYVLTRWLKFAFFYQLVLIEIIL
jgi:hypothetical protein